MPAEGCWVGGPSKACWRNDAEISTSSSSSSKSLSPAADESEVVERGWMVLSESDSDGELGRSSPSG